MNPDTSSVPAFPAAFATAPASGANAVSAGPTDAQLRTALYFAVGTATEGGTNAHRLSLAGNIHAGVIQPVSNSGYTVGMIQTDLGQLHPTVDDLAHAYQDWADTQHPGQPGWALTQSTLDDLKRTGQQMKDEHDIDATQKKHLNAFLDSDAGRAWTHQQDMKQIDELMQKAVGPMQQTRLYKSVGPDDQIRLAVVAAKAYNQNPNVSRQFINRKADDPNNKTVDQFMAAVKKDTHINSHVRDDSEKALHAADVVVALRHAQNANPLKPMWTHMEQDMAQRKPPSGAEGATMTNLFIQHGDESKHPYQPRAVPFITALDNGQPYPSNLAADGYKTLVTSGRDFVTLDRDLASTHSGYAQVGGHWTDVSSDQGHLEWLTNKDRSRDLHWTPLHGDGRELLHMPAPAQQQHPQQQQQQHQHSTPRHTPTPQQPQPAQQPFDPRHPQHPEHALDQSVRRQLQDLHASQGLKLTGQQLDNCTAAALADARGARMRTIDSVDFAVHRGTDRTDPSQVALFQGTPGDPAGQFTITNLTQAANTPAEQSYQQFAQSTQSMAQQDQQMQAQRLAEQQSQGRGMQL